MFVSMLATRLPGSWKTTLVISFVSKGFPYKDQIEELCIVTVSFCVFPMRNMFQLSN